MMHRLIFVLIILPLFTIAQSSNPSSIPDSTRCRLIKEFLNSWQALGNFSINSHYKDSALLIIDAGKWIPDCHITWGKSDYTTIIRSGRLANEINKRGIFNVNLPSRYLIFLKKKIKTKNIIMLFHPLTGLDCSAELEHINSGWRLTNYEYGAF